MKSAPVEKRQEEHEQVELGKGRVVEGGRGMEKVLSVQWHEMESVVDDIVGEARWAMGGSGARRRSL